PDGHDAWVASAQDGTISLIDLEHKRLRGILSADVKGANRLKYTPDGQLVFVSTLSGPEVTVLRSLTGSVVKRVPVGHGAAGIVIQPDGARAYVACTPDDSVAVIDVRSDGGRAHRRRRSARRSSVGGAALEHHRLYRLKPEPLEVVDDWLDQFRRFWSERIDPVDTNERED